MKPRMPFTTTSYFPTLRSCFNEAEAMKPRMPSARVAAWSGSRACFNEAEAMKPRMPSRRTSRCVAPSPASMRPRR